MTDARDRFSTRKTFYFEFLRTYCFGAEHCGKVVVKGRSAQYADHEIPLFVFIGPVNVFGEVVNERCLDLRIPGIRLLHNRHAHPIGREAAEGDQYGSELFHYRFRPINKPFLCHTPNTLIVKCFMAMKGEGVKNIIAAKRIFRFYRYSRSYTLSLGRTMKLWQVRS